MREFLDRSINSLTGIVEAPCARVVCFVCSVAVRAVEKGGGRQPTRAQALEANMDMMTEPV